MFDPSTITSFLSDLMTREFAMTSVLTFFTCYGIFKMFEGEDNADRWSTRFKVITSLVFGALWGLVVIAPVEGLVMGAVYGFLAGGATTVTVDQFKH